MSVVLFSVNTSYVQNNLAIRCLAAALTKKGVEALCLEGTEKDSKTELLAALFEKRAAVYAFSTYIWNVEAHLKLAANLKKLLPEAKILFGGPEVSFHGEDWLAAHPYIDCLIRSEGEEAIVTYCKEVLRWGDCLPKEQRILEGGIAPDFEKTPAPYREGESLDHGILYYESARGCPFHCAYCLSSHHTAPHIRAKSVDDTLADLARFEKISGVQVVKFIDRTFNFNRERAFAIWEALLSPAYSKRYHFEVCASLLDERTMALLARFPAGKLQFEIGVQSTDPEVLAAVHRQDDPEKTLARLEELFRLGNIHLHADLIVGLPKDNIPRLTRSFHSLYGKCHQLQLGFLKLLGGTAMNEIKQDYHAIFTEEPPYEILSCDGFSFEEIAHLKRMAAALERFGNSGRFPRSVALLADEMTPFGLFSALADRYPDLTALSQRQAYTALLALSGGKKSEAAARVVQEPFSDGMGKEGQEPDPALKEALALDFLEHEQGRLPPALAFDRLNPEREEKRAFLEKHPEVFLPGLELYSLPLSGHYWADRKNGRCYPAD